MSAPTPNPATPPVPSRRILLVDDNPEFTEVLKVFLLGQPGRNWIVHTADSYSPALEILNKNAVNLVVLDIQMPVMDGLQFLTLLKRTRPALPVIILSGLVTDEKRGYALDHGAALVLDKMEVVSNFKAVYPALEASAEAPTTGFKGVMREVGLADLVQMECLSRKSSVLEINGANSKGRIFINDGTIVHAECAAVVGEPALGRLLGLKGGEFHFSPFSQPTRQTIDGHWEALLMEAARVQDEEGGPVEIANANTFTDLTPVPAAPPQAPTDRHVEEMVICSAGNEILYQWQKQGGKDQQNFSQRRERLLDSVFTRSSALGKILPLGRADRFEVTSDDSRVLLLLQPDRKVFVRMSIVPRAE